MGGAALGSPSAGRIALMVLNVAVAGALLVGLERTARALRRFRRGS
jgi:hypothetical protein